MAQVPGRYIPNKDLAVRVPAAHDCFVKAEQRNTSRVEAPEHSGGFSRGGIPHPDGFVDVAPASGERRVRQSGDAENLASVALQGLHAFDAEEVNLFFSALAARVHRRRARSLAVDLKQLHFATWTRAIVGESQSTTVHVYEPVRLKSASSKSTG
jgi:hypothetical protein